MSYQPFGEGTDHAHGSFETFRMLAGDVRNAWQLAPTHDEHGEQEPPRFAVPYGGPADKFDGTEDPASLAGWYWAAGVPGCLWDGDPVGPFETETDAIRNADEQ